jgi:hypothetical protein
MTMISAFALAVQRMLPPDDSVEPLLDSGGFT